MGTNYFAVKNGPTTQEPLHIGKSSIGWLFCFERKHDSLREPPVEWNTWPQVREWLRKNTVERNDYVIMDEYDEIISFDDFVKLVEDKQKDIGCLSNSHNFTDSMNIDGYRFTDRWFR